MIDGDQDAADDQGKPQPTYYNRPLHEKHAPGCGFFGHEHAEMGGSPEDTRIESTGWHPQASMGIVVLVGPPG